MSFVDGDLPSDAAVHGDLKLKVSAPLMTSVSSSLSSVRSSHSAATPDAQQATQAHAFRWHFDPSLDVISPVSSVSAVPLASCASVASVTVDGRRPMMDSPLVTPHIVAPSASDDVLRSLVSSLRVQVQASRLENEQVMVVGAGSEVLGLSASIHVRHCVHFFLLSFSYFFFCVDCVRLGASTITI
jgi:hypothetical protein